MPHFENFSDDRQNLDCVWHVDVDSKYFTRSPHSNAVFVLLFAGYFREIVDTS